MLKRKKMLDWNLGLCIFFAVSSGLFGQASIATGPRTFVNLNGIWEVHANEGLDFVYPPPADGWKKETVPQTQSSLISRGNNWDPPAVSTLKREGNIKFAERNDISAWYRREFDLPAEPDKKMVKLTFNCMCYKSVIWLNGKKVGECVTGYTPTSYDVTDKVKWGEKNDLIIGLAGVESLIDLENDTYLAPFYQSQPGILGDVFLEIQSPVYIDDIFVITSVKHQNIDVRMSIVNTRKEPVKLTPSCIIKCANDHSPCVEIPGEAMTLAAGETKDVVLSKKWTDPVLWSPGTPFLYFADCKLKTPSAILLDEKEQRFGFREFEIKGKQFYLNGSKITLYRDNASGRMEKSYQDIYGGTDPRQSLRETIGHPFNNYRIWGNNPFCAQLGDEMGATMAQVLAVYIPKNFPVEKQHVWLPILKEHIRKVMKTLRNHPSIVIWNLTNETYWGNVPDNQAMKAVCREIVDTVREMDSTRPLDADAEVGWDGLLDIISIHYPGLPGDLSQKYPNSGGIIPNDLYWLKDKNNHSWRAGFDWDKPLSIGEDWHICGTPDEWSYCGGEDVYNWVKYTMQSKLGRNRQPNNSIIDTVKKSYDAYRIQGVACLNPWSGNGEDTVPRVAVRPLDFHPNFYGGRTAKRKVAVFYESNVPLHKPRLQSFLTVNGKKIWESSTPVNIKPGESKVVELLIDPPQVTRQEKAELTVRLRFDAVGGKHEKARYSETVFIMPEISLADVDTGKIALLDPAGATAAALKRLKFDLNPLKILNDTELKGKNLLVVAGTAELEPVKNVILDFAAKGGNVIFLQRQKWQYLGNCFPEQDKRHVASRVWKRSHSHPVGAKLDDRQLSYWRPDNLVGKLNFLKPFGGDSEIIFDAAGVRGLEWTPLCETRYGDGNLIFSQLSLTDRLGIEPAADTIMAELIRYGLNHKTQKRKTLRLLTGDNKKLEEIFSICRIEYNKGLEGNGPILLDSTYPISQEELQQIKLYAENGGDVWIHGFTPENAEKINWLLPFKTVLQKANPSICAAVRISDSPLMDSLSTRDFFWAKVNIADRGDYLEKALPTAKLGDYVLALPTFNDGEPLLEPAFLVEIPVKKGRILFDTLEWEKAFDTEGDRVVRIVSSLALNQDAGISKPKDSDTEYFPVDIASCANMGYVDEVAGDGKGGWLDMGKADLCFFLTNHTGMEGGDGAPIATEPFPEENRFCGIPFKLTDPKKNNGKGLIALRSTVRGLKLPDKVQDIPVGRKADRLWFINAANYVPHEKGIAIAKYIIYYNDGSKAEFPLRSGIEINDWCPGRKPEKARICWTGMNRVHKCALYLTEWINPFPQKKVKSISIVGALRDAQIGVIGITGGTKITDNSNDIQCAKWDFGKFQDGKVPDSLGQATLYLKKKGNTEPIKAELNGQTVLKLDGTQFFNGNLKKIPNFTPSKPFTVEIEFSIDELPAADNQAFGIYQAMAYRKSGFCLSLFSDGRLKVWGFSSPDGKGVQFKGKTQLSIGQPYTVSLSFEDKQIKMMLNGKLEFVSTGMMPAPYDGEIIIGHSSGGGFMKGGLCRIELIQNTKYGDKQND